MSFMKLKQAKRHAIPHSESNSSSSHRTVMWQVQCHKVYYFMKLLQFGRWIMHLGWSFLTLPFWSPQSSGPSCLFTERVQPDQRREYRHSLHESHNLGVCKRPQKASVGEGLIYSANGWDFNHGVVFQFSYHNFLSPLISFCFWISFQASNWNQPSS